MPVYCYTHWKTEKTIERVFPIRRIPKRVVHEGQWYERDIAAEHRDFRDTPGNWPMVTDTLDGVCSSSAKELSDYLAKKGVPTEVRPNGDIVYRDNDHRNKVLKARGMRDRDAGFGQWAGEH